MAYDPNKTFNYEMNPDGPNVIIDEGTNNSFIGIREVRWDPNVPFKIDLRRYVVRTDGEERPSKGLGLTEETADAVTEGLVEIGRGRTDKMLKMLFEREDFEGALASISPADNDPTNTAKDMLDHILEGE